MSDLIAAKSLNVGYGSRIVVGDVSFSLEEGKILTLIGPNGSGKSTILKSITHQLKPLGGMVYLDGTPMQGMKESMVARQLSMVMTERVRAELMTCREVVATGRYPYTGRLGILTKEDWKKVDEAMTMVHAEEIAKQKFACISDGQRQRVMLARAICQDTKVMILDEPTSYLDMRYKLEILSHIRRLAVEKNMTVVMSLHELDLAQKISDYIACVEENHMGKIGTTEEIFEGNYIQKLYKVSDESFHPVLGTMHFPSGNQTPVYFVIAGGGTGIPVYRKLQRDNIPFATGILAQNDIDYPYAKAAASEIIETKAFYPIEKEQVEMAKKRIAQCENCICALDEFGPYNQENRMLKEYALSLNKLRQG